MSATANKTHQEYFTRLKLELEGPGRLYAFNVMHSLSIVPRNLFAFINVTPFTLCGVLAYIEHFAFEVTHDHEHSLEPSELIEIIGKFYFDVTILDAEPLGTYHEIDLYENWEAYSGFPMVEQMPELHRDGLLDYIQTMAVRNGWGQHNVELSV